MAQVQVHYKSHYGPEKVVLRLKVVSQESGLSTLVWLYIHHVFTVNVQMFVSAIRSQKHACKHLQVSSNILNTTIADRIIYVMNTYNKMNKYTCNVCNACLSLKQNTKSWRNQPHIPRWGKWQLGALWFCLLLQATVMQMLGYQFVGIHISEIISKHYFSCYLPLLSMYVITLMLVVDRHAWYESATIFFVKDMSGIKVVLL